MSKKSSQIDSNKLAPSANQIRVEALSANQSRAKFLFSDIGSEVLCTDLMILNDISELKLTEDEEKEYKLKIDQMPTQLAFDQLKKMLHATGNPSKSIVLEKNEKRTVRNILPEALESRRNRKITHVVNVDEALTGSSIKQR